MLLKCDFIKIDCIKWNAFIRRSFSQILKPCAVWKINNQMFDKVLNNPDHVLYCFLPSVSTVSRNYSDRELMTASSLVVLLLSYERCTAMLIDISCSFIVSFICILLTACCQLEIKRLYIHACIHYTHTTVMAD